MDWLELGRFCVLNIPALALVAYMVWEANARQHLTIERVLIPMIEACRDDFIEDQVKMYREIQSPARPH